MRAIWQIENKTNEWIRIKKVTLDFGDKAINDEVKVPVGADLYAWAKAAEQNKAISDYNERMIFGSIAAVGLTAAALSHDRGLQLAGAVASLGAIGGLSISDIGNEKRFVELAKVVPESHMMYPDFVIPPGLHAKKWITFYTKEPFRIPKVRSVIIAYTLENGKTERALLPFRSLDSSWQAQP